jgi:hypothetical protein
MSQLGRISGPLLLNNLVRDGVNLTFRNAAVDPDLLVLEVNERKLGINVSVPDVDLDINSTAKFTNGIVNGTRAEIDNIIFNTNGTITTTVGPIIIAPTGVDAYVEYGKVLNTDLELKDNYIQTLNSNQNLEIDASGTGKVDILASTAITGNLGVTGNINSAGTVQLNGQFIIGDSPIDTVTITPDFSQNITPGTTLAYDLGKSDKRWAEMGVADLSAVDNIQTNSVIISSQMQISGNTITSIQSNDDLVLNSSTGNITIESLTFNQGTITNNTASQNLVLVHTGTGYLTITDTNAIRIPAGTAAERPGIEIGETRWNTDLDYLECFDGTTWQVATGGGVVVTPAVMEELGHIYTLVFG